jgi:meso-butanediol dehydrogenase/(S,S)-butanediol dehydrogenase/diacetyl reductase
MKETGMKTLEGKVAIVTGSGQGVGQGIAFALSAEGSVVVVAGRTESKLNATCEEIEKRGGRATPMVCDVTNKEQIEACVAATVREHGTIDILVNNAQMVPLGMLLEVREEDFIAGFDSGPLATLRFMKACYSYLKGGGSIVNLGTSASLRWDPIGYGAYAAVKEATRSLTRAAACEWGPDGIRVNAIVPLALSPGMDGWMKARPEEAEAFLKMVPLGRVGDCEIDIGRAVVFLVGPDSGYITGATLPLDGGQSFLR